MTSIAGDQTVDRTMQDQGHEKWTGGFDLIWDAVPTSPTGIASTINRLAVHFSINDFTSRGLGNGTTPSQLLRLGYMFNLYEEFQMESIQWEFHPRWTELFPSPAKWVGGATLTLLNSKMQVPPDSNGDSAPYQNKVYFTIVPDKTDQVFANFYNNVYSPPFTDIQSTDEYFTATHMTHATNFHSLAPAKGFIHPYEYGGAIYANNAMAAVNTSSGQVVNPPWAFDSAQRSGWKSCRVLSAITGYPSTENTLNTEMGWNGMKIFSYDPFSNDSGTASEFQIGFFRFKYTINFRGREYRQAFGSISLEGVTEEDKQRVREMAEKRTRKLSFRMAVGALFKSQTAATAPPARGTQTQSPQATASRSSLVSELLSKRQRTPGL